MTSKPDKEANLDSSIDRNPAIPSDLETKLETLEAVTRRLHLKASTESLGEIETLLTQIRTRPLTVVVVGPFSSGKTSLLNRLFGEDLFPVGLPETTQDTNVVLISKSGTAASLPGFLPQGTKPRILSSDHLPDGALFVDTPGFQSRLEAHDRIAATMLQEADVVLACADAQQGPSASMLEFLASRPRFTAKTCLLLTKKDLLSEEQLAQQEKAAATLAQEKGIDQVLAISTHTEQGLEALRSYLNEEVRAKAAEIRAKTATARMRVLSDHLIEILTTLLDSVDADEATLDRMLDGLQSEAEDLRRALNHKKLEVRRNLERVISDLTRRLTLFGDAKAAEYGAKIAAKQASSREYFRLLSDEVLQCAQIFSAATEQEVGAAFSASIPAFEGGELPIEKFRSLAEIAMMIAAAVILPLPGLGNIIEMVAGKVLATMAENSRLMADWVSQQLLDTTDTVVRTFRENCTDSLRNLDRGLDDLLAKKFFPELQEKQEAVEQLRKKRIDKTLEASKERHLLQRDIDVLRSLFA